MKRCTILAALLPAFLLTSCVTDQSSGGIASRRLQPGSMLTASEAANIERQQRIEVNETSVNRAKRYDQREQITHPIDTANDVLGGLNGVRNNVDWLRR